MYSSTPTFTKEDDEEHDAVGEGFVTDEFNWREHPSLPENFDLPSITVPSRYVHTLLSSGGGGSVIDFSPFLASHNVDLFQNVHPRIKLVRNIPDDFKEDIVMKDGDDFNGGGGRKAILLDPDTVFSTEPSSYDAMTRTLTPRSGDDAQEGGTDNDHTNSGTQYLKKLRTYFTGIDDDITLSHLASLEALPGPNVPISLNYTRQTIGRILSKVLPESALPPPTGFEQNGHVVHMNLKSHHLPYKHIIGAILLDRLSPNIETIVNKVGEVSGQYRTFDMEILAGKSSTIVTLSEDGVRLTFDLRKVYWCTRLSGERARILAEIQKGQIVADAFCGVGAICILAACRVEGGCTILANDLNPDAVQYCRNNAKVNGVFRRVTVEEVEEEGLGNSSDGGGTFHVSCGDAFDFLQNLGTTQPSLPHHVLMNYPPDSTSFLGALRWWPSSRLVEEDTVPIVHLYIFARDDDENNVEIRGRDTGELQLRNATEVAIDMVADGLVPEGGAIEKSRCREKYLNGLGCNIRAREVRDVAPGKSVIYVSFQVTADLIRTMQGDFVEG